MPDTVDREKLREEFAQDDAWKDYFYRFAERHGGLKDGPGGRRETYFLEVGEWLLFPDGWRYSATSYAGPELPPPASEAERRTLLRTYWLRRLECDAIEHEKLEKRILRLQRSGREVDEALTGRFEWLANDMDDCNRTLAELNERPPDDEGEKSRDEGDLIGVS